MAAVGRQLTLPRVTVYISRDRSDLCARVPKNGLQRVRFQAGKITIDLERSESFIYNGDDSPVYPIPASVRLRCENAIVCGPSTTF
jgi:hypothetical protein